MYKSHKLKNVLITGATGFIGQALLQRLSKLDLNISIVARNTSNQSIDKKFKIFYTNDLFEETEKWWADVCIGIDLVIHLAWYVNPADYLSSSKNIDCLLGSIRLANGAITARVKKFVGIGTCFEYDCSGTTPIPVSHKLDPKTLYASSKVASFHVLSSLFRSAKIDFSWARFFFLYGEGENPARLVPYLKEKLVRRECVSLTDGMQVRDFLTIDEAVEQLIDIAFNEKNGPYNICSGNPITIRDFVENIANLYDGKDLLQFGSRPNNLFDPHYIVGKK